MKSSRNALAYRLAPQLIALVVILLLNFITSPQFFNVVVQNGRLYGSLIDVLNRGAPVALSKRRARVSSLDRFRQDARRRPRGTPQAEPTTYTGACTPGESACAPGAPHARGH